MVLSKDGPSPGWTFSAPIGHMGRLRPEDELAVPGAPAGPGGPRLRHRLSALGSRAPPRPAWRGAGTAGCSRRDGSRLGRPRSLHRSRLPLQPEPWGQTHGGELGEEGGGTSARLRSRWLSGTEGRRGGPQAEGAGVFLWEGGAADSGTRGFSLRTSPPGPAPAVGVLGGGGCFISSFPKVEVAPLFHIKIVNVSFLLKKSEALQGGWSLPRLL